MTNLRLLPPYSSVGEVSQPPRCSAPEPAITPEVLLKRSEYLARRFSCVFFDFRLRETLPTDWIVPKVDGLHFGLLNHREADRAVLTLEDYIRDGRPGPLSPGPGQRSFFRS
jgi:hypothetical protein